MSTDRATVSGASGGPVALAEAPLVVRAGPGGDSGTPELAITIDPPGLFTAGGTGSIHVTVTSVGTADVLGPETVIDVLPAGFTFTGWTGDEWSCSAAGQTVTCTRAGPLAIGASRDFSIQVAVAQSAVTGNNLASVSPPPGGLGGRMEFPLVVAGAQPSAPASAVGSADAPGIQQPPSQVPQRPNRLPNTGSAAEPDGSTGAAALAGAGVLALILGLVLSGRARPRTRAAGSPPRDL